MVRTHPPRTALWTAAATGALVGPSRSRASPPCEGSLLTRPSASPHPRLGWRRTHLGISATASSSSWLSARHSGVSMNSDVNIVRGTSTPSCKASSSPRARRMMPSCGARRQPISSAERNAGVDPVTHDQRRVCLELLHVLRGHGARGPQPLDPLKDAVGHVLAAQAIVPERRPV